MWTTFYQTHLPDPRQFSRCTAGIKNLPSTHDIIRTAREIEEEEEEEKATL